jgi:DNA-binding MarR family transcriptional regulator
MLLHRGTSRGAENDLHMVTPLGDRAWRRGCLWETLVRRLNAADVHDMNRAIVSTLRDWSALTVAKGMPRTPSGHGNPDILLGLLTAVESDSQVTQRKLSTELGIALGLANLYLKRCVRKGWIKIGQVPMRRYAYYLTPKGFSEKARLTGEYLAWNLEFFRRARKQSAELFARARAQGFERFALIGAGELAEVAVLSAAEAEVEIVGVIDRAAARPRCAGKPVYRSAQELLAAIGGGAAPGVQALMVTQISGAADAFTVAREAATALALPVTPERILLPRILNLAWPVVPKDKGAHR